MYTNKVKSSRSKPQFSLLNRITQMTRSMSLSLELDQNNQMGSYTSSSDMKSFIKNTKRNIYSIDNIKQVSSTRIPIPVNDKEKLKKKIDTIMSQIKHHHVPILSNDYTPIYTNKPKKTSHGKNILHSNRDKKMQEMKKMLYSPSKAKMYELYTQGNMAKDKKKVFYNRQEKEIEEFSNELSKPRMITDNYNDNKGINMKKNNHGKNNRTRNVGEQFRTDKCYSLANFYTTSLTKTWTENYKSNMIHYK